MARGYKDDLLPPETKLAQEFGVSRPTIRMALQHLVTDGLISRQPGSGTRIHREVPNFFGAVELLSSLTGEFRRDQIVTLSASTEPVAQHPGIDEILRLDDHEDVHHIHRILSQEGYAYGYSDLFCPPELIANVPPEEMTRTFLIELVVRYSGHRVARVRQAVSALSAGEDARAILRIGAEIPILCLKRTYYSGEDRPLVHIEIKCRGDRFEQVVDFVDPTRGHR